MLITNLTVIWTVVSCSNWELWLLSNCLTFLPGSVPFPLSVCCLLCFPYSLYFSPLLVVIILLARMCDVLASIRVSLLLFLSLHCVCSVFVVWALRILAVLYLELGKPWWTIQASRNLGRHADSWLAGLLLCLPVYMQRHFPFMLISLSSTNMGKRGLRRLANALADNTSLETLRYDEDIAEHGSDWICSVK